MPYCPKSVENIFSKNFTIFAIGIFSWKLQNIEYFFNFKNWIRIYFQLIKLKMDDAYASSRTHMRPPFHEKENKNTFCTKHWSKSQVIGSWSFRSLGEVKSLFLAKLGTKEIMEKFKFKFFSKKFQTPHMRPRRHIWSILPRAGKICNLWSKTRNTFCVVATKLHLQISWLMSLCKHNYSFVMKNVLKSSWSFLKPLNWSSQKRAIFTNYANFLLRYLNKFLKFWDDF